MPLDARRELAGKATQHPLDLREQVEDLVLSRFRDERQVAAQNRFAFQLAGGTHGHVDKATEFPVSPATASFGDVGANRDARAPHLSFQSELHCQESLRSARKSTS
jgi:hypothetical protein